MPQFYHVDRSGTLQAGMDITLTQYKNVTPRELQQHADELFPDGVSHHGSSYFLGGKSDFLGDESNPKLASFQIDVLLEYVRRAHFPRRPSRFQSVFATDSLESAQKFRQERGQANQAIWEVRSEKYFPADEDWLSLGTSVLAFSYSAHRYWSGEPRGPQPSWEFLLSPPVKVIQKVD